MSIEIKVPVLPESVADATVSKWHKKQGDAIKRDEVLVEIETDKVVLEVPAPADGVLAKINEEEGATVSAEQVIGMVEEGSNKDESKAEQEKGSSDDKVKETVAEFNGTITEKETKTKASEKLSPAVRRMISEHDLNADAIKGSGKDGKITKQDVEEYLKKSESQEQTDKEKSTTKAVGAREEQRIPMTRLRARIAERLLGAQHNAAILTTFNEINMHAIMDLRKQYKESFEKKHGVRLGFMSFFTKAVIAALKEYPDVNAFIDDNDIVYHNYCDIGIAVSTERGLVVPILRNAENMSMAEIEKQIVEYGRKAHDGKLTMEEMTGGTFTITNGGVFGSLMSTPIINPPQSGILGMHKIEERAVVEKGQVVIRPMMYVALSYDHRIIDGKESVMFLRTVKELIEDPARLLLDV